MEHFLRFLLFESHAQGYVKNVLLLPRYEDKRGLFGRPRFPLGPLMLLIWAREVT